MFFRQVLLYSSSWPGTHYVDQTGWTWRSPPVYVFLALGWLGWGIHHHVWLMFWGQSSLDRVLWDMYFGLAVNSMVEHSVKVWSSSQVLESQRALSIMPAAQNSFYISYFSQIFWQRLLFVLVTLIIPIHLSCWNISQSLSFSFDGEISVT